MRVAGWVHRRRDHGGLIFVDLRDRSGIVQLVFDPRRRPRRTPPRNRFHNEDVVSVVGAVTARDAKNVNPNIATGGVELRVSAVELLSAADPLPFSVEDESRRRARRIRLTYRYIETRRPRRLRALELRARIARATRRVIDAEGFLEVETPILIRSTPEGARDFIVPSRLQQGKWYALPQSPQLFKQLLMVGGLERYYQIVRCFRDEDLRADRQPEFTQVRHRGVVRAARRHLPARRGDPRGAGRGGGGDARGAVPAHRVRRRDVQVRHRPPRHALRRRDHRLDGAGRLFGLGIFAKAVCGRGGGARDPPSQRRRGAVAQGPRRARRRGAGARSEGARVGGVGGAWRARIRQGRFLSGLADAFDAGAGDLVCLVADAEEMSLAVLGTLRVRLAERFGLVADGAWAPLWVTDFPLVEWNADDERWDARHHPFTSPRPEDIPLLATDPGRSSPRRTTWC